MGFFEAKGTAGKSRGFIYETLPGGLCYLKIGRQSRPA
jgi:hypothetical protein